MKSNYLSASTIVKSVLLKAETKTFDVKIRIKGETYLVGVTTKSSDELIENFDFSHLPNDLTDEQIEEITDKISETLNDFSMDKSKHIRDDQKEIDHFYKGLKVFDNTLEEPKNVPSPTESELKETTLRLVLRKVESKDLELFRWYLSLKEPTLSEISMVLEQLNDYHKL